MGLAAPAADAATYVTHCSSSYYPGSSNCPTIPNGARHTYKGGRAASNAFNATLIHSWYVAYTNSVASSPKYTDAGPSGVTLYSSFPNNTELLRGYSLQTKDGALFGDGFY